MPHTLKTGNSSLSKEGAFWADNLLQSYYASYFDGLTSRQLDEELSNDLMVFVNIFSKLPESNQQSLATVLGRVIEFYIEKKVEKELDDSIHKLFQ